MLCYVLALHMDSGPSKQQLSLKCVSFDEDLRYSRSETVWMYRTQRTDIVFSWSSGNPFSEPCIRNHFEAIQNTFCKNG